MKIIKNLQLIADCPTDTPEVEEYVRNHIHELCDAFDTVVVEMENKYPAIMDLTDNLYLEEGTIIKINEEEKAE